MQGGASGSDITVTCAIHGKMRKANVCMQVPTPMGTQWECTRTTRCKGDTPQSAPAPAHNQQPRGYGPGLGMGMGGMGYPGMAAPYGMDYGYGMGGMGGMGGAMGGAMGGPMGGPMGGAMGYGYAQPQPVMWQPPVEAMDSIGMVMCVVHNKKRTMQNMQELSAGFYRCKENTPCKITDVNAPRCPDVTDGQDGNVSLCSLHGRTRKQPYLVYDEVTQSFRCRPGSECKVPATMNR